MWALLMWAWLMEGAWLIGCGLYEWLMIGLALCGRGLWRGHGLRLRIDYVGVAYGGAVPCDWAWIVWVWLVGGVA